MYLIIVQLIEDGAVVNEVFDCCGRRFKKFLIGCCSKEILVGIFIILISRDLIRYKDFKLIRTTR
jgi:hypothetical protein